MKVIIKKNDDGFLALCPEIKGAFAEGDTKFEAFYNLIDIIKIILEYKNSKETIKSKFSQSIDEFEIPIFA